MASFNVENARSQFPALKQEQVFMDNAGEISKFEVWILFQAPTHWLALGGSQVLGSVVDAWVTFFLCWWSIDSIYANEICWCFLQDSLVFDQHERPAWRNI